jgi:hypothetical protein
VPFYCTTPGHKNPALNGETLEAALQMRCISCGAERRALTLNDTSKSPIDDDTLTVRRRLSPGDISCHNEVAGIEAGDHVVEIVKSIQSEMCDAEFAKSVA